MKILICLLLCACISNACRSIENQDPTAEARKLNNQALTIYQHNLSNTDSLKKALALIDTAISIKKSNTYFTNRYAIARRLHRYDIALNSCDSIIANKKNDFSATLHKGFIYEDLNLNDSSSFYYRKALALLDSVNSIKGEQILIDKQKIILIGLLNDSTTFKKLVSEFDEKYKKSPYLKSIDDELKEFNRKTYLLNF